MTRLVIFKKFDSFYPLLAQVVHANQNKSVITYQRCNIWHRTVSAAMDVLSPPTDPALHSGQQEMPNDTGSERPAGKMK